MPFVCLGVAAFYLFVFNDFGLPMMTRLTAVMAAAVAGFYAPNLFLANRISKRRQSIMQAFPDALSPQPNVVAAAVIEIPRSCSCAIQSVKAAPSSTSPIREVTPV